MMHRATRRIMAEVTPGTLLEGVPQKALDLGRRIDKITKTGVVITDKSPDNAQQHQAQHGIAGVDVQDFEFIPGNPGDRKGQQQ